MILKNRENIFSALDEGIIAADLTGKILYANDAAAKYFDYPDEHSRSDRDLNDYFEPHFKKKIETHNSDDGIKYFETYLNNKEVVVILNNLYEKKELSGYVIIMRDMSEMSELSNKLTIVESLFDDLRAQSHEYKNRLHLISGLLEMEKYNGIREVLNDEIENIDVNDKHLNGIGEDRIKALIIAKMNKANEKQVSFIIDEDSQMPNITDKRTINALITIISNLIDNSIDAVLTRHNPQIILYIGYFEGWMEIIVQDNGSGIEDNIKIFEKGYSTKEGENQRGYGLYNISTNVELLGGYIDVESANGKTVFTVEVPI